MTTSTNWKHPTRKAFAARAVPMNQFAASATPFIDSPAPRIGPITATIPVGSVPVSNMRSAPGRLDVRQTQAERDKLEYAQAVRNRSVRYVWRWDGDIWKLWAWSPNGTAAMRWVGRRDKGERWRFTVTHGKDKGPHWIPVQSRSRG